MIFFALYFVATTLLTIALAPRPPTPKAASITDFQLPTADQGRNIPVIFGTVNITGANCVWYGDLYASPIRQHLLFSSNVIGFQYFMGFHLVLGHGPFDSINKVYWDKKLTWMGDGSGNPITASGQACMSWLNLYGGEKSQGGIQGCFDIIMGTDTEPTNTYLQGILGNVPAYRGVTSAVWWGGNKNVGSYPITSAPFTQDNFTVTTQAAAGLGYIGTQPYIKAVEFEATRVLNGWNSGGLWYSAKASITQSTIVTSPPTWAPTFEYAIYTLPVTTTTQTEWNYNTANTNFSAGMTGYIYIGTEWVQIDSLQIDSDGFLTGIMFVTRGLFGTTPSTYATNTLYYVYVTTNSPVTAMNAAHVVYQCLTDPRWGLGIPISQMDDTGFRAAADTFYSEGMGLCMQWVNASTVQDFLKIVLDHCAANLIMENATGLYTLVPIRGGYNVSTLPTYDETVIKELTEFNTQAWADEVNQVILVYTDPGTRVDTAITGQDISNIDVQGKIVSQTVNLQGIRSHTLAANVLGREMTSRCTPLIKIKISINRIAYATNAAGLFLLNWADKNVEGVVMRITNVDKGKLEDNTIVIDAVQDIYSLGLYNYQVSSAISGGGTQSPTVLTPSQVTTANTPPPDNSGSVLSASLTAPPSSPADGARYIVAAGATGAWSGESGNVAVWDAPTNSWTFITIPQGTPIYNQATGSYVTSNGSGGIVSAGIGNSVFVRGATFSAGSATLTTPTNAVPIYIAINCTLTGVTVLTTGGSGSCTLYLWKAAYGSYPPTSGGDITGGSNVVLSSAVDYQNTTLTSWTTSFSAGDVVLVTLNATSVFTSITITLALKPA